MPIYVYWGEDDFAIEKAVNVLRVRVVDPMWMAFNYTTISPEQPDNAIEGLNQIMTPPFGTGGRLVWLVNTTICQQCPDWVLAQLQRTLPAISENSFLLLTIRNKPDERLKSTKLFKQHATEYREFALIPAWKTELLLQAVKEAAKTVGVKLTTRSVEFLAESVGNNTRLLYNELEKIQLYAGGDKPLDTDIIAQLVRNTTQTSLQLAAAIRTGNTAKALGLVTDLLAASEPGLRIVATLISQFRTWLWVKIMIESGEHNQQAIADAAEVGNHKRIYFLQQEIKDIKAQQLTSCLPLLLELEVSLKQGASEIAAFQNKVIELCRVCMKN